MVSLVNIMNTPNIINVSMICTGNNTIMTAWYWYEENQENSSNEKMGVNGTSTTSTTSTNNLNRTEGKKTIIKTIKTVSAGRLGLKGARRGRPYAAELVGRQLGQIIESNHQNHSVVVYMAGKMVALGSALRGLRLVLIQNQITNLVDVSPKPHNGCRARKPRRI